ncbi:MAG: hypothetical protein AAF265_04985 [Pseudomonadota bacterium]
MSAAETSPTTDRWPKTRLTLRWILAGPVALIAAILLMAITPVVLPSGASGVNNLVFAIVLFPLYWGATVIYAVMADRLRWASLVFLIFCLGAGTVVMRSALNMFSG